LFGDPVIAKGKGFEIKRGDLDKIMTGIKSEAAAAQQTIPPQQLKLLEGRMLRQLVAIQMLLQTSTPADKVAGTKRADAQFAALIERAGSESTFDMQLKAAGISKDELHNTAVQNATAMAALQRQLGIATTDKEAMDFYTNNPADFEAPETAHVRQILLTTMDMATGSPLSDDAAKAKRKQADDILKRLRSGEDFAKLAAQYSDDPGSKSNGGELPPVSRNQLSAAFGPQFESATFSLKTNQVSDVVVTGVGYHIIKLIDKTPSKKIDYATVSDKIKDYLANQKVEKLAPAFVDKLEKNSNVEILDADLKKSVDAVKAFAATNTPVATP
jgi:parvulin-like peptidyl-prolyl isomerase